MFAAKMGGGKSESFGAALDNLMSTSSAHGLPNIHRSKSVLAKAFWTLLFFISVTMLIMQVTSLFRTFLAYKYAVSLDIKFERTLDFPAVTICNVNPVRRSKLIEASDDFRELFDVSFDPGPPPPPPPPEDNKPPPLYAGPRPPVEVEPVPPITPVVVKPLAARLSAVGTTSADAAPTSGIPTDTKSLGPGPVDAVSMTAVPSTSGTAGSQTQESETNEAGSGHQGTEKGGNIPGETSTSMPRIPHTDPVTLQYSTSNNSQNSTSNATKTTEEPIRDWHYREKGNFFEKPDEDYLVVERLISRLANLTENERKAMGHDLNDMLLDCQWKGYPCSPTNFTSFYHYKFGNCYTFNSLKFGKSLKTNRPGPLYGLSLELFLQQDEFMPEITESAGFRIVVHDRDTMPFPEDDGIAVSPGYNTAINVRVVTIERLGYPYGNCTHKDEIEEPSTIFKDRYGVLYSLKACERSCYQKHVEDQCGCFNPHYPSSVNISYPCDIDDDEAQECMAGLEEQYKKDTLNCNCYQRCNDTTYLTAASSSIWPSDQFQKKLFRDLQDVDTTIRDKLRGSSPRDWVGKNVGKVEVFFQEFNYQNIKQTPAYTELDLISDIGGQLGLWLGLSVLTLMELIEHTGTFFAIIFSRLYGLCCRPNSEAKTKVKNVKIFPIEDHGMTLQNF